MPITRILRGGFAATTMSRVLWTLSLLLLLTACAKERQTTWPRAAPRGEVSLEVQNHNWADMVVSVQCGSARHRLGVVTTNSKVVFTLPRSVRAASGQICFVADPIGSDEVHESPRVVPMDGERYVWTIEAYMPQSSLVVR